MTPFNFLNLSYSHLFLTITLIFIFMMNITNVIIISSLSSVGFTIIFLNFIGLIPYFWPVTCLLWGVLLISMVLWSLFYISALFKYFTETVAHLLPLNSPTLLWLILIVLESVSQIIRPFTLSLRLSCNLMAGHVLMSLTMNLVWLSYLLILLTLFFEVGVSVIQAVVYSLLSGIYKKEVN